MFNLVKSTKPVQKPQLALRGVRNVVRKLRKDIEDSQRGLVPNNFTFKEAQTIIILANDAYEDSIRSGNPDDAQFLLVTLWSSFYGKSRGKTEEKKAAQMTRLRRNLNAILDVINEKYRSGQTPLGLKNTGNAATGIGFMSAAEYAAWTLKQAQRVAAITESETMKSAAIALLPEDAELRLAATV